MHVQLAGGCGAAGDHLGDAIEIVIVPDLSLVHARYSRGRDHEDAPAAAPGSERVIILIDRIFFEHRARVGRTVPRLIERRPVADEFMCALGALLLRELKAGRVPTAAYLDSLAVIIAVHTAAHHCAVHSVTRSDSGLCDEKLSRVTHYVQQHLGERVTVRRLAELVHMSVYHFARLFKQATGTSPHLYITLARVERAKALLRATEQPIVQIAAAAGFQTQGHFTAVFHRHAHVTPRVYRLHSRASGVSDAPPPANRDVDSALSALPAY
jgi:AraC family transcriptional regulator